MAARSGSFGTSLNPFGTGSFGGLSQYNIGDSLKDLEAYRIEIAWGNGLISDEEYAASLARLVAAADPGSQAQLSAQNKLDDVTYRIGRSKADAQGLDALIAFDQQALSGMNPSNLRYRDVKSSLDSELANRRSRDYGLLVDAYNDGKTSTESLLAWVESTLASLPADAPDADNWDSVHANLIERVVSEKDAQVYQDYQDKKMSGADFVSYLTGRRDAYSMDSPKWDEADRRLNDAIKNVKDAANAKADQEFFNLYSQGKKSDTDYLKYVKSRIDGMDPTDPQLPDWKFKLSQAAHSIAEDQLRHEVTTATSVAGDAKARKNLRDFYVAYSKTLNPGSAEYRRTEEQILALKPAAGGGGGARRGGTSSSGGGVVVADPGTPKIIPTTGSFDHIVTLLTPNANSPKKSQQIAIAALRLNLASAQDAKNDKVWLYHDPRYPGQMVTLRNPDGTVWKDPKTGATMKVPGSSYRLTSSDEIAALQMATADYSYGLAGVAAAKGDVKGYWTALWHANVALDDARGTQAHAVQLDITNKLKALDAGIEVATKLNDPASVVKLLLEARKEIRGAMVGLSPEDPQLERWQTKDAALENNPLFPVPETDLQGNEVEDRYGNTTQVGGFVDIKTGQLVPGTHFVLDTDSKGKADWGYVWEDPQIGTWGMNHITVQTGAYGQRVVGEVEVKQAPTVSIRVSMTDGSKKIIPFEHAVNYISYRDGYGNLVSAYSIDGKTWLQATGGTIPVLELNGKMSWTEDADGSVTIADGEGNVIFTSGPDGVGWEPGDGLNKAGQAGAIGWFGQANVEGAGHGVSLEGVGYPGQHLRLVNAVRGPDGGPALNLVPREILYAEVTAANSAAGVTRVQRAGAAPGASLAEESAAIRARGLQGTPTIPLTGSDYVRFKRAEAAALKAEGTPSWDTRAEETNAIEARASVSYISPTTGFNLRPNPATEGIISIGSAIVNIISPPTWVIAPYVPPSSLTPIQPYVPPSSLTPPKPYVPPSSLTQPPKTPPKPYVPPSSLTQPPKPTPVPVAPRPAPPKYLPVKT